MQVTAERRIINDVGELEFKLVFTDAEMDAIFADPANNATFSKTYSVQWTKLTKSQRAELGAEIAKLIAAKNPEADEIVPDDEEPEEPQ